MIKNRTYSHVYVKLDEKLQAIELRKQGYSIKEMAKLIPVSKSTLSLWVRAVELSSMARERLDNRYTFGQQNSQETLRKRRIARELTATTEASAYLSKLGSTAKLSLLLCSLIYWCEGNKTGGVKFTNSDPQLIASFLALLRKSFPLDEKRLQVCVHLHDYHNKEKQLRFWSNITNIPLSQFMRPYLKPSNHKYAREGYHGCACVSYGSNAISRVLRSVAEQYLAKAGELS